MAYLNRSYQLFYRLSGFGFMFTHWSREAKFIHDIARLEAAELNHSHCGTEHLLLAILRSGDNLANHALRELALDYMTVKKALAELYPAEKEGEAKAEHKKETVKLTQHFKTVIEDLQWQSIVRPEHILQTLIAGPKGPDSYRALEILEQLSVSTRDIRKELDRAIEENKDDLSEPEDRYFQELENIRDKEAKEKLEVARLQKEEAKEKRRRARALKPLSIEECFAPDTRALIADAIALAEEFFAEEVGSEHFLLALTRLTESNASKVLLRQGVTEEKIRTIVADTTSDTNKESKELTFSHHAMSVLRLSYRESQAGSNARLEADMILLGLLAEVDCRAYRILAESAPNFDRLRLLLVDLREADQRELYLEKREPLLLGKSDEFKVSPKLRRNLKRHLSDVAEETLKEAAQEAIRSGDRSINSKHLLLGVLHVNDPFMSGLFESLGINTKSVRDAIDSINEEAVRSRFDLPGSWQISLPVDDETNDLIASACKLAGSKDEKAVTIRHLTTAIVDNESCAARQVLNVLRVDPENLKALLAATGGA